MKSAKCATELEKIIKYSNNCGEKEGNLAFLTVIVMAAFETKNVHSAMDGWSWANSLEQSDFNENKHMRRKQ